MLSIVTFFESMKSLKSTINAWGSIRSDWRLRSGTEKDKTRFYYDNSFFSSCEPVWIRDCGLVWNFEYNFLSSKKSVKTCSMDSTFSFESKFLMNTSSRSCTNLLTLKLIINQSILDDVIKFWLTRIYCTPEKSQVESKNCDDMYC